MRILGHVTTAVQTIKNGFTSGNFQFSAKVVLDLNKNLDTFSIAGHKMSKQLSQDLPVAADQAQDDDRLPSRGQWHGRETTSSSQGELDGFGQPG